MALLKEFLPMALLGWVLLGPLLIISIEIKYGYRGDGTAAGLIVYIGAAIYAVVVLLLLMAIDPPHATVGSPLSETGLELTARR